MRTYFPWCALVIVAGLALGWEAHAEPQSHASPSEEKTPPATQTTSPQSSVPVLTRQEALIQGLKQVQLSSEGMRDLVKATDKAPSLTPAKFNEMVDGLVTSGGTVTKDQGDELKTLFKNELGAVKNSPVGTELNVAAKRLLEAKESTRVTSPETAGAKNPQAGQDGTAQPQAPNGQLAGNAALGPELQAALDAKFGQLAARAKNPEESLVAKQLALTQDLLKNLQAERGASSSRRGGNRESSGLLDALRAGLLNDKKDKEEGGNRSLPDLGDLKNAFAGHQPPPPPRKKEDDSKKIEPPPRPDRDRGDRGGGDNSALAALLKGKDSNTDKNNQNKDGKAEEKFELPPSKSKDELDKKNAKAETPKAPPEEPQQDPSELMKNLLAGAKGQGPQGNSSPLPGMSGGGGFGGGFGGGDSGGGGSMGPNIVGSASAPPGGNFGGDPFSGLGGGEGGGGGSGGYSFSKSVAYGGLGGGEAGGGGVDAGGGDASYVSETVRGAASKGSGTILMLSPVEDGTKRSLLDYFGKLKGTLCVEGADNVADLCHKISGRKYIDGLNKRAGVR